MTDATPGDLPSPPTAGSNHLRDQVAEALRGKQESTDSRPSYRAADAVMAVVQPVLDRLREEIGQTVREYQQADAKRVKAEALLAGRTVRLNTAEAAMRHLAAEAHRRKWVHEGTPAFSDLHNLGNELLAALGLPKETR